MQKLSVLFAMVALSVTIAHGQVTFIESAYELNMGESDYSSGVAIVDVNNDLVNEIFVVNLYDANRFYIMRDLGYIEEAEDFGIDYTYMYHSVAVADVNYDYLPDFYVTGSETGYNGKLFVNSFPEPFNDMAEDYNLLFVTDMSAAFFQMTYASGLCVLAGRRLMELQHDSFVDITEGSGLEELINVFDPVFFDIDGDIDDDLFIAGNWELNIGALFRNNGDGTFTDISSNTDEGGFGYGQEVTFGDIDNDGDFDIYLCSGFGTNSMWQNDGTGYFTNFTEISNTGCGGYSRGANFGDFDNDGDLDLFVNRASAPKMFYLNTGDGIFIDYSQEAGIVEFAGGFGCAVGDLNGNGHLDIVVANSDFVPKQVYINQNTDSTYLKVKLVGRPPNTLALGAVIELLGYSDDDSGKVLIGKREISSHPSLHSVNDLVAHFGTGDYTKLRVIVSFQSGATISAGGVTPGRTIILEEPDPTVVNHPEPVLPRDAIILNAYPNPFNNRIMISISSKASGFCSLNIYDLQGRLVRSGKMEDISQSRAIYNWDGKNSQGEPVPSGVYFVRVRSRQISSELKITLIR